MAIYMTIRFIFECKYVCIDAARDLSGRCLLSVRTQACESMHQRDDNLDSDSELGMKELF